MNTSIYLATCPQCGKLHSTSTPDKKYCSNACKMKAYRKRMKPTPKK